MITQSPTQFWSCHGRKNSDGKEGKRRRVGMKHGRKESSRKAQMNNCQDVAVITDKDIRLRYSRLKRYAEVVKSACSWSLQLWMIARINNLIFSDLYCSISQFLLKKASMTQRWTSKDDRNWFKKIYNESDISVVYIQVVNQWLWFTTFHNSSN